MLIDMLSDLAFLGVVPVAVWALVELVRIRRYLSVWRLDLARTTRRLR